MSGRNSLGGKSSYRFLIGLWNIDKHYSHIVSTQHDTLAEVHYTGRVMARGAPNGLHDVIYQQESMANTSMCAIVRQILDRELTLIAEIAFKLQLLCVPQRSIKQGRVDSLLVQPGKRKMKAVIALSSLQYSDLNYEPTVFSTMPWKKSTSDSLVVKTEILSHDSSSILGPGDFKAERSGNRHIATHPRKPLTLEAAREHVLGGR